MHSNWRTGAFTKGLRLAALFTLVLALPSYGQQQKTLTIEEAIELARENNPDFQALRNDAGVADWNVREAYGGLLPGASARTNFSYQASGPARFGIFTGADLGVTSQPEYYSSDYSLGLSYALSGSTLLAPGRAKADRRATEASIDASQFALEAAVTRQYLLVLRAQDGVTLTRQELERAKDNRRLAEARVKVGAAIPMELKQAEVEHGRAEVALLQAANLVETERLRLMQQLGLEVQQDVQLTSRFEIFDIPWTLAELTQQAIAAHPTLLATRATVEARAAGVKIARSSYLPSLSLSLGWSGFTREAGNTTPLIEAARGQAREISLQCQFLNQIVAGLTRPIAGFPQNCPAAQLSAEQERQIIAGNDVFPFNYSRDPLGAQLTVSLPIFQGFTRERNVQVARAAAQDAEYRARGEELRIKTEVATAYLNLTTARRSVALETRNRELAAEQLELARERYRLGAASFLELQDAVTIKARADRAYLIAVYQFHESMAALETAVGRDLR